MTTLDLLDLRRRIERARRVAAELRERGAIGKAVAHERLAAHLEAELARRDRGRQDKIRAWRA